MTSASDLASWVLPTPAGPSSSSGLPSRDCRKTVVRQPLVGEVAVVGEAVDDILDRAEDFTRRFAAVSRIAGPAPVAG